MARRSRASWLSLALWCVLYLVVSFVLRPAWLLDLALLVVWAMGATLLWNLDVLRADGQERRHEQ
ncbi:hypothetical protein [Nocardioides panaciterrulae]|uniref:Uncharacterized protein n=1 Tax=Nocardioides panaciterrulae TaxID=661492 RepID=A0A7Y9E9W9_9ACTN|nr:hypothetical protein [Nocardioides panaciterrulae]NYD43595.1 hypothetical protein [Nocardioides panaciterrulae]